MKNSKERRGQRDYDGFSGNAQAVGYSLANDIISLGRIRHIPVVEDGRLVGLLSERDLMGAATTTIFGLKQKSKSALLKSVLIKDVMKKKVVTVMPETPIKGAAHLMRKKKIGCVPVVQCEGPGRSADHNRHS